VFSQRISAMAGGAARSKEDFKVAFAKLVKISKEKIKRKSEDFLKAVIVKFGTAEDVLGASAAKKATLVASAWALLLEARNGHLEKEYSLEAFEESADEGKDAEEAGGGASEDEIEDVTGDAQHYIRLLLCKTERFSGQSKPGKIPVFKTKKVEGEMTFGTVSKTVQNCLEEVGEGIEARNEFTARSGIALAPGESLKTVDFYLKIAGKDGAFQNLDKDTQNLSSLFEPFDATKLQFLGKGKQSEEVETSSGASILVGISVLKTPEEPTVSVEVRVKYPVIRKRENNDDELACTASGTISSFTLQVTKADVKRGGEAVLWDQMLNGCHVVLKEKLGGGGGGR
jgi:hypothetical protein